jgi:acyl carrier protein
MNDVKVRLEDCFRVVFPDVPDGDLSSLSAHDLEAWDSLATVTLVSVIQEEFEKDVPADAASQFVSFDAILGFLTSRCNK